MDTFRDRDGNINIHGDRDNNANLNANCNGNCQGNVNGNVPGNFRGNSKGNVDGKFQGNVDSNVNAKLNTNIDLNLHFGFRRTNPDQGSHTIFVPIAELNGAENISYFGYPKRYAVFCIRN